MLGCNFKWGRAITMQSDRNYQVTYQSRGGILRFHVKDDIDAQHIRISYWQEIVFIATQHKVRKLLVFDRKKHKPADPSELAALASIMKMHAENFDGIAIIEPTPHFMPALEHGEIHAQENGLNVRIFTDEMNAERWLLYGMHLD
jgi:hypothetical protein